MIGSNRLFSRCVALGALSLLVACSPQQPAAGPSASASASPSATASPSAVASASPAPANPTTIEPPTTNGIYIQKGACPGEGCYLGGKIKGREAVDLLERVGKDSPGLAKTAANEWVEIVETEDRIVPLRGVVKKAGEGLAVGDVVYLLGYEGEGCSTIWNKGKLASACDEGDGFPIDFDKTPDSPDPTVGFWVQAKRSNGQVGWLSSDSLGKFACTGFQDRDADCPPLPQ